MQSRSTSRRQLSIPDPADRAAAEEAALRIITAAAQTEAGLITRLRRRGFDDDTAAFAAGRMVELRYVDDGAYAAALVARRQRGGQGAARIGAELRHKGVTDDDRDVALPTDDGEGERERAVEAARRAFRGRDGADPRAAARLAGVLARRGFRSADCLHAVRVVMAEVGQEVIDAEPT